MSRTTTGASPNEWTTLIPGGNEVSKYVVLDNKNNNNNNNADYAEEDNNEKKVAHLLRNRTLVLIFLSFVYLAGFINLPHDMKLADKNKIVDPDMLDYPLLQKHRSKHHNIFDEHNKEHPGSKKKHKSKGNHKEDHVHKKKNHKPKGKHSGILEQPISSYNFTIKNNTVETDLCGYIIEENIPINFIGYPHLGLFIADVEGQLAPVDQYWAVYCNGEYRYERVNDVVVKASDDISLKLEDISEAEALSASISFYNFTVDYETYLYDYIIEKKLPIEFVEYAFVGHCVFAVKGKKAPLGQYWAMSYNDEHINVVVDDVEVKKGDNISLALENVPMKSYNFTIKNTTTAKTDLYDYILKETLPFEFMEFPKIGHVILTIENQDAPPGKYWALYLNGYYSNFTVDHLNVMVGDNITLELAEIGKDSSLKDSLFKSKHND